MITVLFFAKLREDVGLARTELPAAKVPTMADAIRVLGELHGARMVEALAGTNILMACNHDVVDAGHPLADGDEIAFYPPVSGG